VLASTKLLKRSVFRSWLLCSMLSVVEEERVERMLADEKRKLDRVQALSEQERKLLSKSSGGASTCCSSQMRMLTLSELCRSRELRLLARESARRVGALQRRAGRFLAHKDHQLHAEVWLTAFLCCSLQTSTDL
jgi:hypothetical protein